MVPGAGSEGLAGVPGTEDSMEKLLENREHTALLRNQRNSVELDPG